MFDSCKNCEKREIGCHGKCEDYQRFRAKQDLLNALKMKREQRYSTHVTFTKGFSHGKIEKVPRHH